MTKSKLPISINNTKPWEIEWEQKVNEVMSDFKTDEIHEFGYKYHTCTEVFAITDWGNIKRFISKWLQQEREELIKRIEGLKLKIKVEDDGTEKWGKGIRNQALYDVLDILKEHKQS